MQLGAILIIPAIASCLSLLPLGRRFAALITSAGSAITLVLAGAIAVRVHRRPDDGELPTVAHELKAAVALGVGPAGRAEVHAADPLELHRQTRLIHQLGSDHLQLAVDRDRRAGGRWRQRDRRGILDRALGRRGGTSGETEERERNETAGTYSVQHGVLHTTRTRRRWKLGNGKIGEFCGSQRTSTRTSER